MSRRPSFREDKKKGLDPIWRGIGFIILAILTVGGYFLTGYLIDLNQQAPFLPFPLPTNFSVPVGDFFKIRGRVIIQIGVTLFLDILAYGVMVIIYAMVNPLQSDLPDEDGVYRRR